MHSRLEHNGEHVTQAMARQLLKEWPKDIPPNENWMTLLDVAMFGFEYEEEDDE